MTRKQYRYLVFLVFKRGGVAGAIRRIVYRPHSEPIPAIGLSGSEGKNRKATHVVKVVHFFSFLGHVAKGDYCERHANEFADEYKRQIKARKYRRLHAVKG